MAGKKITIVGGRSQENSTTRSFPQGIEILLKKAKVNQDFRIRLLDDPFAAADGIGLELNSKEKCLLKSLPRKLLESVIDSTEVPKKQVEAFRTQAASALFALLFSTAIVADVIATGAVEKPVVPYQTLWRLSRDKMGLLQQALEQYRGETGMYPTTEAWQQTPGPLEDFVSNNFLFDSWSSKFKYAGVTDKDGNVVDYVLESDGESSEPGDNIVAPFDPDLINLPVRITSPERFLKTDDRRVRFFAEQRTPDAQVFWYLDDELIGSTVDGQELLREVGPGRHVIRAVDTDGDKDTVIFTISDSL
jgi:hypothetical protein